MKKRGAIPSQTRISVQDARALNTPVGAAHENEEMRRIQLGVNRLADELDAIKATDQPVTPVEKNPVKDRISKGGDTAGDVTNITINGGGGGKWALTVLHRGVSIFREKWQQALNFLNPKVYEHRDFLPVLFDLKTATINDNLKADPTHPATQVNIEGMVPDTTLLALEFFNGRKSIQRRENEFTTNYPAILGLDSRPINTRYFELVNDQLNPSPTYYYGTDDTGEKGWQDLRAVIEEFSWSITGTEHNTVRFNADGELVETNIVRVIPGGVNQVEVNADLEINNGKRLIINDPTNLYPTSFYANLTPNTAVNYYLPVDAGLTGQVLESDGTGNLAWVYRLSSLPAGTIHQTLRHNGTTWEATDSLKTAPGYIDINVPMQVNNGNVIQFWNTGNTNFVALTSHNSLATDTIYTLPLDDGTLGQVLTTDGVGRMSWETVAAGATNQIKLYKLDFNKALPTPQTHPITLPINSEILRITVRVDATLSGSVGQIKINGSTSIILADEGIHYLSAQGKYDTEYTGDATIALAGMVGNLEYVQFGVGSGSGRIFIEVGVPI